VIQKQQEALRMCKCANVQRNSPYLFYRKIQFNSERKTHKYMNMPCDIPCGSICLA
jgi:hypothetical protein